MHRFEKWLSKVPGELGLLALILLAAAPLCPFSALCGAFSWGSGLLFCRICKVDALKHLPLNIHFNLAVIGFALAMGRDWSTMFGIVLCLASVSTTLLTTMINRLFYYYWIPVLCLPAILVSLASKSIVPPNTDPSLLISHASFGYGIGIGGILCAIVSPIFFAMLVAGMGLGSLFQVLFFHDHLYSLELLLCQGATFASCASVFSMPSKRSLAWSVFATGILSLGVATPDLTAKSITPFSLFCWANVASALSLYGSRIFGKHAYFSWASRPEAKLEDKLTQWQRFRAGEARVGLPFDGTWKVSQSFDGPWTHRGIWKHGLDFIVTDENGRSFKGSGTDLTDYYAFGKEVQAPVSGYIVALYQDYPDNPVGTVKNQNNFGNFVVIRDAYGAHVLLGHLKRNSVVCALYQYVEANQAIAQCGNSGYSPEPHIHMHVQADAVAGSPTIGFHLTNFLVGKHFHFHGVPTMGETVTKLSVNNTLARSLGFRVHESFSICSKDSNQASSTTIENRLDPYWGSMYFTDGKAKLFHYRDALTFYFYRYEGPRAGPLFDLMTALPRVPIVYEVNCTYEDLSPVMRWDTPWQRLWAFSKLIFAEKISDARASFELNCAILEVKGQTRSGGKGIKTSCFLDPVEGFIEYSVGDRKYEVISRRELGVVFDTSLGSESTGEKLRGAI